MPVTREKPTIVDWVVVALSPVLVMLMVGSLAFFLVEVLYAGQYTSRLISTLFFFVIGAVLIARISIEQGSSKAWMYGLLLGLVTFLAFQAFVEYPSRSVRAIAPLINLFLMSIVWWSANKLTWDCTHLDEDRKSSGRGILSAAGLESKPITNAAQHRALDAQGDALDIDDTFSRSEEKKRRKDPDGFAGWMARWNRYRAAQKAKPHTPGTWIVYFSLAAFPIFGLGQSLIPADDAERRRATFMQMTVYVGSGLMLLVTTSLLGLRKYLRERNAKIPASMTLSWLGLGAAIVVVFLAVGAVLPRPHSETPLIDLPKAGMQDRNASKFAQKTNDGAAGKGPGNAGNKNEAGKDAKASGKNGEKGGNAGEKGDGGGKGKDQGGKNTAEQKDDQGGGGQKQDQGKNGEKKNNQNNQAEGDKNANDAQAKTQDENQSENSSSSSSGTFARAMQSIGSFVKWIVWAVIAIMAIGGIAIFILRYLAPFTTWAKNLLDWLRGLFARKDRPKRNRDSSDDQEDAPMIRRPPPFADFSNPFADGSAKRMSLPELIEYSFTAMDAWAWDHDSGRLDHETPNEFATRIVENWEPMNPVGPRLATLFVRSLYSRDELPAKDAIETLRTFWRTIESFESVRT